MKITEKISSRTAGLCGIFAPIIAFVSIATSILIHPWFNWADNALSDLGALETSYMMVFNFGLIAAGILGLAFTFGLSRLVKGRIGLAGATIFGVGIVFSILAGVFPEGTSPHVPVSTGVFLFFLSGHGDDRGRSTSWEF